MRKPLTLSSWLAVSVAAVIGCVPSGLRAQELIQYAFQFTVHNTSCTNAQETLHIFVSEGGSLNVFNGPIEVPAHSSVVFTYANIFTSMPFGHAEVLDIPTSGDGVLNLYFGDGCDGDVSGTNNLYTAAWAYRYKPVYALSKGDGKSHLVRFYRHGEFQYQKVN